MNNEFLVFTWTLFASTALLLGWSWRKVLRSATHSGTSLNLWTTAALTAGYLYFIIAFAMAFTPWNQMLDRWWIFREPEAIALLNVFVGLAGVVLTLLKRDAARPQIVCSSLSLIALSLLLFCLLSWSQI